MRYNRVFNMTPIRTGVNGASFRKILCASQYPDLSAGGLQQAEGKNHYFIGEHWDTGSTETKLAMSLRLKN
jgi:hypothetical protein